MTDAQPRLHTELVGAAGAERLVLLHGFTQNGRCWGRFAEDLARDHELAMVDLPGHGGSAHVEADLTTAADLVLEAGGRGTYVGYSLGGRVALHAALRRPDLVARLVLIGATGGIDDEADREDRCRADELLAYRIEEIGVAQFVDEWLAQPLFSGLTREAAAVPARLHNTPGGLASSLRSTGTGTQEPLWDQLGAVGVPVLVMTGVDDVKFSALGTRLARAVGPNATVALVPRSGHSTPFENPADSASIIRRWLRTHPIAP
ncbi:MAG TPA: alpha/beta fold hydrolase [Acidimicrobiales bacterium]